MFEKLVLTALVGMGCFIVGIAFYLFSKDRITLVLSGLVLISSLFRCYSLYHTVLGKKYEVVKGTCISISKKTFRKYSTINILDDTGIENTLRLGSQSKIKIGFRYRFYFTQGDHLPIGNEYLDTAMSSNHFLGYEELGEFSQQK